MCTSEGTEPIRIACIGASVTKGTGLEDPATESYPAKLASFLPSSGYPTVDVQNFGEGGAGVLKRGSNPYCDNDVYGDALVFDAHVLVVHLGTNDSRTEFWDNDAALSLIRAKEAMFASFAEEEEQAAIVHGELEFEQDLEDLVEVFGRMPSEPQIFLCTPVPLFDRNGWLNPEILCDEIAPRIRRVAARKGLRVIDLFDSSLAQRPDLFPDGLHPSAAGAAEIAAIIGQALLREHDEQKDDLSEDHHDSAQVATGGRAEEHREAVAADQDASTLEHDDRRMMEEERQIVQRELYRMKMSSRSLQ